LGLHRHARLGAFGPLVHLGALGVQPRLREREDRLAAFLHIAQVHEDGGHSLPSVFEKLLCRRVEREPWNSEWPFGAYPSHLRFAYVNSGKSFH